MSDQAMLKYFMYNGEVCDSAVFAERYRVMEPSCYEVIRVIDGRPLFLDEHYQRLVKTAESIGQTLPFTQEELEGRISRLARINEIGRYNVKLIYHDFTHGGTVYLFFTPTSYPTDEMYAKGVRTDLLQLVRENPHAKIINQSLRDQADALMAARNLYEAVLVNAKGEITEGSKSNLFFIRDGILCTSPADGVLLGVTRQRIIRLAEADGIQFREERIPVDSLENYSAAFISGTSPKVLPIATMGEWSFDVHDPVLRRVMQLYDEEIQRYLAR